MAAKTTNRPVAEDLPDPSGKRVIIIGGEFTGHEGVCLGSAGEPGIFAVSPSTSNKILRLRFDEEFGILINSGQEKGKN